MAQPNHAAALLGMLGRSPEQYASALLHLGVAGVIRQLTQAADQRIAQRRERLGAGASDDGSQPEVPLASDRDQLEQQLRAIVGDLDALSPDAREQLERQLAEQSGPAAPARRKRDDIQAVVDSQLENRPQPRPRLERSGGGWMDKLQAGLDVVGVADPTPISDGVNAAISLGRAAFDPKRRREHLQNAGISAVSAAVPYVGDSAKLLKVGRAAKPAAAATEAVSTQPAARSGFRSAMRRMGEGLVGSLAAGGAEPPEQPPRFGGPSPAPDDGDDSRRQREDAAGVAAHDKWTEKLKDGALSLASFAGKVYLAIEGLQLLNRGVLALNKDLSQYNGTLAGSYAKGENADIRRDMRRANALAGPLSDLQEEQSKLQDSLAAFRTPIEGALIKLLAVGTKLTNIGVQAVQLLTPIQPILAILEWFARTENDEAPGGRQFLQDLSDGKFDGFGIDDLGKRFELLDKATRGQMGLTSQPGRPKKGKAPAP